MSHILQLLLSNNKTLSFCQSVTVLHYVVSLGNWHWTFRDNLVVSCPTVQILKNISLHADVCANLLRKVTNQLTSNKSWHLSSKVTECSWSHSEWFRGVLQQGLKQKNFKRYLESSKRLCFDIIKMCLKETSFDLRIIYSTISCTII